VFPAQLEFYYLGWNHFTHIQSLMDPLQSGPESFYPPRHRTSEGTSVLLGA
jgi:hypothetical protein